MKAFNYIISLCCLFSLSASAGCFRGDTDNSEWIKHTITFETPLLLTYNSDNWEDIRHFTFNFGHQEILNPRSFKIEAELVSPVTEHQLISGKLEEANSAAGAALYPGNRFNMNLNDEQYFDLLKSGSIELGLGRTGSDEELYLKNITAKFCGEPVLPSNSVTVDASKYTLGNGWGEMLSRSVDQAVTYALTVSGSAADGNEHTFKGVSVDYIDPRTHTRQVKLLTEGKETYVHSDGMLHFFYVSDTQENIGGHTVVLKRVNLD